jgi:hypothetical protein
MKRLAALATSNSVWLGLSNLVWCLLVAVTPLVEQYPKLAVWILVGTNVAFIAWKYFSGTLPEPTPAKDKSGLTKK